MASKLDLSDGERALSKEMLRLSTDDAGNETYVGLTQAESIWYLHYNRHLRYEKPPSEEAGKRFLALHQRHESARQTVLRASIESRGATKN